MSRLELKQECRKLLLKINAIQFGNFILSSGKRSNYYIDLRLALGYPNILQKLIQFYVYMVKNEVKLENFDRIAGIATAGIPFSLLTALELKKPYLYVRKEPKPYGRERQIEGILKPKDRILIVDDLITTGNSIVNAANVLRSRGAIVTHAIVLIDREEGGRERLAKEGIKLHRLLGVSELGLRSVQIRHYYSE